MKPNWRSGRTVLILTALMATVLLTATAHGQNKAYQQIYEFGRQRTDGWDPEGTLAVGKKGDLYGVTEAGGTSVWGTVYKLTAPQNRGGKWTRTTLYDFPASAQELPTSLIIGKDGALYGAGQGPNVRGFIFRLTPPPSGHGLWIYEVLYTLNSNAPASEIMTNMVFDATGNLYGATQLGGDFSCFQGRGCGTVFELKRPAKSGGKWRFRVLYAFTGTPDGDQPFVGVTFDQNGNL